jgi:Ca2+/Na+ antiporter
MSEAFHSNAFNVLLALLVPAVIVGLGSPTGGVPLAAFAYLTLTAAAVVLALAGRGLGRPAGLVLIGGYLGYVALVVAT